MPLINRKSGNVVSPKRGAGAGVGVGTFWGRGIPFIDNEKLQSFEVSKFRSFRVSNFQNVQSTIASKIQSFVSLFVIHIDLIFKISINYKTDLLWEICFVSPQPTSPPTSQPASQPASQQATSQT